MKKSIQKIVQKKFPLWWKPIKAILFENSSCPEIENENWLCKHEYLIQMAAAIMALKTILLNWISSTEFQFEIVKLCSFVFEKR